MAATTTCRYVEDPLIRSMRIRTWYRAVEVVSGLRSRQLEELFTEGSPKRSVVARSCIWDKYRRGEVVPRSSLGKDGSLGLVDRVEQRYPETARWLFSPLWRLADKAPMEMGEIRQVYEGMPKLIRSIFVHSPQEATGLFWRRPVAADDACDILGRFRDFDALVALLTMVKEAETIQDQTQYACGVHAVKELGLPSCIGGVFGPIVGMELTDYLNARWAKAGYFVVAS